MELEEHITHQCKTVQHHLCKNSDCICWCHLGGME